MKQENFTRMSTEIESNSSLDHQSLETEKGGQDQILEGWAEKLEQRLNIINQLEADEVNTQPEDIEDEIEKDNIPTGKEAVKAIRRLEDNKSPGINAIPSELLKYEVNKLKNHICKLITLIWRLVNNTFTEKKRSNDM